MIFLAINREDAETRQGNRRVAVTSLCFDSIAVRLKGRSRISRAPPNPGADRTAHLRTVRDARSPFEAEMWCAGRLGKARGLQSRTICRSRTQIPITKAPISNPIAQRTGHNRCRFLISETFCASKIPNRPPRYSLRNRPLNLPASQEPKQERRECDALWREFNQRSRCVRPRIRCDFEESGSLLSVTFQGRLAEKYILSRHA